MTQTKTNKDEIIREIDRAITELVYEKTQLIKAYNYYHGKRDPEQFRHLEENYGIGTPTSIEFIPLVRKHVDVLIGEYLSTPILPKISCKDKNTLSNINKEKQLQISDAVFKELQKHLKNTIYSTIYGGKEKVEDQDILNQIETLKDSLNRNYISEYEMAGQNIVDYSMQSRNIDFANKRKVILTDLLVSGTCYYKVNPSASKSNTSLRILNPVNTFIDRNPDSPYLKDSARSVIKEYLTKAQILVRYGDILNKEDLDSLDTLEDYSADGTATYLRSYDNTVGSTVSDGVLGGFEITPLFPFERNTSKYFRLFPTYEVEWLKAEKENGEYIVNRYEGVRIGTNIYIPTGKSENVVRSMDDPKHCTLSINGIFYADRNGDPYSLILSTANLQDKYDCLNFYRDNVIAESGGVGDHIDVAHLPTFLGADVTERLLKYKAYKKSGLALYDSSMEGLMMNTAVNGYDDTIKLNTIQALDLAIQRVEEQASGITGVFRERLGGIEQKDAVTNVAVGVKNSSLITKQYFQIMDLMTREILIDLLNISKIVYKNGISGTLILGERLNKIFTALPEYYSYTDYDVHISDSSEVIKEQETIKQFGMEMTKGGLIDPETLLEIITAKGLTRMKEDVKTSLDKKKKENDQLGQLSQQVQQLTQQLKEAQGQAQKLQQQVAKNDETKMQLEQARLDFDKEIGWYKAGSDKEYKQLDIENDKKRIALEGAQLLDNNHRNDEIKNK